MKWKINYSNLDNLNIANLNFYDYQISSNCRDGLTSTDSPIMGKPPRKSSMLINTDFDEDEDYYDDEHDDFRESHEKDNEGNF